jgi:crotonobetainyl-CoA:carnitine CoA-transferase CaiB-like acyl-CoA transferase
MVPIQTEDGGTAQTVLLPMSMNGRRLGVQRPLPAVGEHNDEVLKGMVQRR